jgi:hypothetical protein
MVHSWYLEIEKYVELILEMKIPYLSINRKKK